MILLGWQGVPDFYRYSWADRSSGVSGVHGSQVIPTSDPKSMKMSTEFEKSAYQRIKAEEGNK